jgi:hypothetical protein
VMTPGARKPAIEKNDGLTSILSRGSKYEAVSQDHFVITEVSVTFTTMVELDWVSTRIKIWLFRRPGAWRIRPARDGR